MRQVIGDVLPSAVIVMVSLINIFVAILLLSSKRPLLNASCYLGRFVGGSTVVAGGLTAMANAISLGSPSDRWREVSALPLALDAGLVIAAVPKYRECPGPGDPASLPGWMDGLARFSTRCSLAIGATVEGGSP